SVRNIPLASIPSGIAFHSAPSAFAVTNNTDGTMTRLDFPSNDYSQAPLQSVFADGGFPGNLMHVGPDAALYVTQAGTRFDDGTITTDSSIARIAGGFAIPPGVSGATPQFVSPPTPATAA